MFRLRKNNPSTVRDILGVMYGKKARFYLASSILDTLLSKRVSSSIRNTLSSKQSPHKH